MRFLFLFPHRLRNKEVQEYPQSGTVFALEMSGGERKFGINVSSSFGPENGGTAEYYYQWLRITERTDMLGYRLIRTVENSFFNYGRR